MRRSRRWRSPQDRNESHEGVHFTEKEHFVALPRLQRMMSLEFHGCAPVQFSGEPIRESLQKGDHVMRDRVDNKVVLLDGRASGDEDLTPLLALLTTVLAQEGAQVQVFSLRELKLARCIGCFACFVETPGICRYGEADGHAVLQAVAQSDTIILFTPVVFGGYSSQLKQIVDRFVSLI